MKYSGFFLHTFRHLKNLIILQYKPKNKPTKIIVKLYNGKTDLLTDHYNMI